MSDLYRLIYTSRNLLGGREEDQTAAVAGILAVSKRNNARVGVTGALLFNAGAFAQVLEGPRAALEATFERIQRDPRHSDVSVLQCEPATARGFPNWSMAFAGRSERGRALWGELARSTDFDLRRIEGDRLFSTLLSIVQDDEGVAAEAAAPPRPRALDVDGLRGALREQMPEMRSTATAAFPAEVETGVLRAALDEERARTTALRRELDDARVALASAEAKVDALQRLGDVWAERARAMAAVICREPDLSRAEGQQHRSRSSASSAWPALVTASA